MVAENQLIKVIHGVNDGTFPVAGATVASVRLSLVDAFNVPETTVAFANGRPVPPRYRVRDGDVLEFVRPWGEKGAGKNTVTEDDLNRLGFSVVGNEAVRVEEATPDALWELDRLVAYAEAQLDISARAETESLLQARKSAVALFRAGCALYFIRAERKSKGRGEWTKLKRERGWKDTTANDAIRLYENAKTPEALASLGITEAKVRYVYPFKDRGEEDDPTTPPSQPASGNPAGKKAKRSRRNVNAPVHAAGGQHDDEGQPAEAETAGDSSVGPALAKELEEIAQRLTEIALNELGKVEDVKTVLNPIHAVLKAGEKLVEKLNERLPDEPADRAV
jgi:sulfur carrier protein ThiS